MADADSEPEPVLVELRNDPSTGAYWQDWYCEPPPEDAPYQVVRDEWSGVRRGHDVRRILEIRLTA